MSNGISWHYVLKFIITGDAAVGKSSLLIRLTDQRFLANPDPTLGVEFGSKLITIPEENKVIKLQCWDTAGTESFRAITRSYYRGAAGCLLVYDVTNRKSFLNARNWLKDVREHADPNLTCILVGNKVDLVDLPPPPPLLPDSDTTTISSSVASSAAAAELSTSPKRAGSIRPSTASSVAGTRRHSKRTSLSGKPPPRTREVPKEEAERWAKEEGLLFVEASAKSGENVEFAFVEASRDIMTKIKSGKFDDDRSTGVKLSKPHTDLALEQPAAKAGGCC